MKRAFIEIRVCQFSADFFYDLNVFQVGGSLRRWVNRLG